ncbi:MAG: hypothetical protein PUB01_03280 [Desulfovibrionaceae bacterium]|nr:hypothetical protein [Desulfovibrionaceae bacterium]
MLNITKRIFSFYTLGALLLTSQNAYTADELGMSDYLRDLNKPAEAHATKVADAWSDNMAYRIEHGMADGVVVDGKTNKKGVIADGVGNIVIKKGAKVGPVINNTKINNSTVIIKNNSKDTRY